MIDWSNLLANSLWIFACALALATLSYANWKAWLMKVSIKEHLATPGIQITLNLAGVLFCIGLAGTSLAFWKQILWGILALGFTVSMCFSQRDGVRKA
jgi:hypothetical protein